MSLRQRQRIFYTDSCELYAPVNANPDGTTGAVVDVTYSSSPTLIVTACRLFETTEVDVPMMAGRTKEVNIFTLDKWHFAADEPAGIQIADVWAIKMTTVGHPEVGKWWYVDGNAVMKRLMNYTEVYTKRGPAPF